jgi:polyketide biosynthesis enoyl-CoA hydratase PksH
MEFETLLIKKTPQCLTITLNRPQALNSINSAILHELNSALDIAMADHNCRMIVLKGQKEFFCSGMDFTDLITIESSVDREQVHNWSKLYMTTLKRFSTIPKVVVAFVEGKAIAGGVGLAAACDLVVSEEKAQFKLSEALWGLLPAMITPFIMRRIGYQKMYSLTLTAQTISAKDAQLIGLVDVVSSNSQKEIDELLRRISRIDETTLHEMKSFFKKMWFVSEDMETLSIETTTELFLSPKVQSNIRHFLESGTLPY